MKSSKNANITVSFSWVFMIIVGTFFLFMAYHIIGTYKDNEEAKYDYELKQTLREVFNEFGRTSGTEKNKVEKLGNIFRNKEVRILCSDGLSLLQIDESIDSNNDFLKNYPTFMTYIKQGKVDETYIAVESYKLPFKTTNLLAIISKRNLIVFDKNSEISVALEKKFRKESSYRDLNFMTQDFNSFNSDVFIDNQIKDRNLNSVMFVTDYSSSFDYNILENINIDSYIVKIQENPSDLRLGKIHYYDKKGVAGEFDYIDYDETFALVTMAIFSSPQAFECSYGMLSELVSYSYDFYIEKNKVFIEMLDEILSSGSEGSVCDFSVPINQQKLIYEDFNDLFIEIKDKLLSDKFNNNVDLITNIDELETYYLRNIEENSCPYLY